MSRTWQRWRVFGAVATALTASAFSFGGAFAQAPCLPAPGGQTPCITTGNSTGGVPQGCTVLSSPPGRGELHRRGRRQSFGRMFCDRLAANRRPERLCRVRFLPGKHHRSLES